MYESHFQFSERPFAAAPHGASYVPAANIEHARQSLIRCVERAEGVGLVIGPAGTGKSLLCQLLADHFRQKQFQVALLASARLHTRRSLLQNILFELNLPYRGMDDEELRLSLIDHLTPRTTGQGGLVLIVDEAHTLSLRLLEEIRLISNFIRDGQPRVRLVLSGGPAMEERLANPKLDSLAQRIAARCYLAPLQRDETRAYVREQLRRAGGQPDEIAPEPVLRAVFDASGGIPRLINQVCDHALILASIDGQKQLTERRIEQAWADLQQLPTPWQDSAKSQAAAQASAIEFGQLGDEGIAGDVQLDLPGGDPLGNHTLAELAQIDRTLDALDLEPAATCAMPADGDRETCSPLDPSAAEMQLLSGAHHDPFGSGFDEEEVVIDRYASLEARLLPDRSRVTSAEGRVLGEALRSHDASHAPPGVDEATLPAAEEWSAMRVVEPPAEAGALPLHSAAEDFDPADDPVLPEPAAASPERLNPQALGSIGDDDRDLLVLENVRAPSRQLVVAPLQRRRQYRQLFSSLRKG